MSSDSPYDPFQHEKWMRIAINLADQAAHRGEVPVGAVIIFENEVIASTYNLRETFGHPLYHAELLAIHEASRSLGRWRLTGCHLYVTLEPCLMCAGAIIQSRMDTLIYGAQDPKGGVITSLYQVMNDPRWNHHPQVIASVLENECSQKLKSFFQQQRM